MATQLPPPTLDEVAAFLAELRIRMSTGVGGHPDGIVLAPRRENLEALRTLDITASRCIAYLRALKPADACQLLASDYADEQTPERRLWVFGIVVKKIPVYIKIQFGPPGRPAVCISFHPANHPLQFLFH